VTTQNAKFNGHIKEMFASKNESKGDLFEKRGPDTCFRGEFIALILEVVIITFSMCYIVTESSLYTLSGIYTVVHSANI